MARLLRVEQWDDTLPEAPAVAVWYVTQEGPTDVVVHTVRDDDDPGLAIIRCESWERALLLLAGELK